VDTPGVYKGSVVIEISDNGPGTPGDKLKDVFRPFYTTKAEGTGLGLYITQQLVEKIKGRISVCSRAVKKQPLQFRFLRAPLLNIVQFFTLCFAFSSFLLGLLVWLK
jgi:signal transduction histidine kinase